ncbi:MAG: restriction endonuclease subunit S [Candidatus Poribacteria bacterium]|nr:restriction endonuclease subunit S [Candidatus Poribacteria bacterium]
MNNINFPKHWKNVQLKELASLRRESIQPENDLCLNYVGLEHIDSGESQLKRWGNASEVKSTKNRFYADDILYGKLRAYLDKVVIAEMEGICSTDILVVTANSKTIPRFLVYLLHTHPLVSHAVATSTGVNHPRTSWNSLGEFTFALPPLPEQRAIAHVLQTIQDTKFTRQREIALERERKAALMDELFLHGTRGESRKQTEIGEIPESWEVVRLGDYCYKPDYGYTESANDSPVGPKFLRITDIQNDAVNWENVPYCICSEEIKEKYLLKTGDIVIARIGATTGKAYIIDDCPEAIFASYLIRVRTKDNLLPIFLAQYFRTNNYWRQIDQSKGGRLKGGVNIPILSHLVLPLPHLSEQQRIAEILQACDTKITALEKEVEHLDELFHAMLDELMTGQRSAVPLIENGEI